MRPLALPVLLLLAGCDLLAPARVEHAAVTAVTVERLPLDARWDGGLHGPNPPDVYVDVYADGSALSFSPAYRSPVAEDAGPDDLPLAYALDRPLRVPLDQPVHINVADYDGLGDDLMFTTGAFTFADRYDGAERGETQTLVFRDSLSTVRVVVRWE
jgi:hypothetical protein